MPLVNLLTTFELTDIWWKQHPTTLEYTWRRPNGTQASRLDMFLVSQSLIDLICNVQILPFFHSDHHYVYMEFSLPSTVDLGPRYWKFNTSHLSDPSFCEQINSFGYIGIHRSIVVRLLGHGGMRVKSNSKNGFISSPKIRHSIRRYVSNPYRLRSFT